MLMALDVSHCSIPVSVPYRYEHISPYYQSPLDGLSALQQSQKYLTITDLKFSVGLIPAANKKLSILDSQSYLAELNKSSAAIEKNAANWKRYIFDLSAPNDVDALSETIEAIYDAIDRYGPGSVNLATLPTTAINGEHLAAILRSTYSFRNQIIGWDHAREIAIKALQSASIDIDDALAGLL